MQWAPLPGYPYEASDTGIIRRSRPGKGTNVGHVLKPNRNKQNGYDYLTLTDGAGRVTRQPVHRWIALAFFGPPPPASEVNHKSADKTDNRPNNLEYVTHAQNMALTGPQGRSPRGEKHGNHTLTTMDVVMIRAASAAGFRPVDICKRFGVGEAAIRKIAGGVRWTY